MKLNKCSKILIVGLGVIGGGYARALSKKGYRVRCITKEQKDIDYAIERGMIRFGTTEVDPKLIGQADLVVFAGMIAQIHHGIAARAAHARLEMAGFIFVRNDADASVLGIGIGFIEGNIDSAVFYEQRFEAEIGF